MKKILFIAVSLILLVAAVFITLKLFKSSATNQKTKPIIKSSVSNQANFKNATYIIDGQAVTLKDGYAESSSVAESSSKTITRYFGNEATGDLNNDGQADIAFLITQDSGGSGTFYYIAAALANGQDYKGLSAIFLGDRIAPQTTEIKEGKIIVNYADRKPDEPFTATPSIAVSRYFKVTDNQLTETK